MEGKEGRTERATPKRREEQREKGNMCISQDIITVGSLLLGLIGLRIAVPKAGAAMADLWLEAMRTPTGANVVWSASFIQAGFYSASGFIAYVCMPIIALAVAGSLIGNIAQTGPFLSMKTLEPKWGQLSPMHGLKSMFSATSLFNMFMSIMKVLLIGIIFYVLVHGRVMELFSLMWMAPADSALWTLRFVFKISMTVTVIFMAMAAVDYAYRWYKHEESMMMTKQEVKEEQRQYEPSPVIKNAQRRKMREMSFQRMMAEVPKATMIVTNPTHVAVALQYDMGRMGAPRVVAKGVRLVAQRIKEIARENNIPIIERPPLARALYKSVKIGHEIPGDFFGAVAELMAYLYRLGHERVRQTIKKPVAAKPAPASVPGNEV